MLTLLKRSRQNAAIARAVYGAIVAQARQAAFYAEFKAPDTLDGRFDMVVLHLVIVMQRLRRAGAAGAGLAQAVFDLFLTDMDRTMRESGVGDLSVPRKMKKIGESFYGRWGAYAGPLEQADIRRLTEAVGRNVYAGGDPGGCAERLAGYAVRTRTLLGATADPALLAGEVPFPEIVDAVGAGT